MADQHYFLRLGDVQIELVSDDARVCGCWQLQFGEFLRTSAETTPQLQVVTRFVDELPSLPSGTPSYVDHRIDMDGLPQSILEAYQEADGTVWLHFFEGGLVKLGQDVAHVWVTEPMFPGFRFEDVTLVTIQPLLRRYGAYMVHASGVAQGGQAMLFVGGSGSGKTTTCLNLVLHGWQMLSNDVVLVRQHADGVYAWPLPDTITLRPKTLTLLPQLADYPIGEQAIDGLQLPNNMLPTQRLAQGNWASPSRIATICFPTVAQQTDTTAYPQMRAIALAVLMQESVDRWDEAALDGHSDLLFAACQQASCWQVQLGKDMAKQRDALAALLPLPTP